MPYEIIKVTRRNSLLAIIVKAGFKRDGLKFFVPDEYPQQLAYMKRPKGYEITPHIHRPVLRKIKFAQEVLFVKSGKVRVDFYDKKRQYAESRVVTKGDTVFLAFGGHGFKFMKDSEMIEVKQGPFLKGAQPVRFEPVMKEKMRLK